MSEAVAPVTGQLPLSALAVEALDAHSEGGQAVPFPSVSAASLAAAVA